MRYLPLLFLLSCVLACKKPESKLHGVDGISPDGDPIRTYSQVMMKMNAADHDLLISMSKLVFLGKPGDQTVLADDLGVVFKSYRDEVSAELKAGTLFYHPASNTMEFGASVLWDVADHGQLETEILSWDMSQHQFIGSGGVRMFGPKAIIEGSGITTDFFLDGYRIDSVAGVYKYEGDSGE